MIRNMTQYLKNLKEELKEESRKKFYSNKKTLEDFTSACKGYKFPLTEADLFWLEDYMDSQLNLKEHAIRQYADKNTPEYDEAVLNEIRHARMLCRLCSKLHVFYQLTKIYDAEKKYKNVKRRTFSAKTVKLKPYYVVHALAEFFKFTKIIRNRKKIKLVRKAGETLQ